MSLPNNVKTNDQFQTFYHTPEFQYRLSSQPNLQSHFPTNFQPHFLPNFQQIFRRMSNQIFSQLCYRNSNQHVLNVTKIFPVNQFIYNRDRCLKETPDKWTSFRTAAKCLCSYWQNTFWYSLKFISGISQNSLAFKNIRQQQPLNIYGTSKIYV